MGKKPTFLQGEPNFRWRGGDVSRVESLSDMVFAFALTLIVVSLEVPQSAARLMLVIAHFPVFAACFALLVYFWYHNYLFHRRFGLETLFSTFLNALLLFLILFYIYPLKYIFTAIYLRFPFMRRMAEEGGLPLLDLGGRSMMLFFSGGWVGIVLLYAGMNAYAYRRRDALGLDGRERLLTRGAIRGHLLSAGIGVISLLLALFEPLLPLAGLVYFLMGPTHAIHGYAIGRAAERVT